jgi:translation initiation factor IF-1
MQRGSPLVVGIFPIVGSTRPCPILPRLFSIGKKSKFNEAGPKTGGARRSLKGSDKGYMPKEDAIEVMGKVVEKFKAGMFAIELDAGKTVLATMAGRLRRNRIKIMNGDKVSLEMSPYDLTKGRITYRHK